VANFFVSNFGFNVFPFVVFSPIPGFDQTWIALDRVHPTGGGIFKRGLAGNYKIRMTETKTAAAPNSGLLF
jgi:hypothetical protein